MNTITEIQSKLKVQKSNYNSFGKYHYRSCEDILEAVKPILKELDCYIIISDKIQSVGDYNYIIANAILFDKDNKVIGSSDGIAREADAQKGMNPAQLTGSTSSYARKYALNGLLAIDDTKDDDHNNKGDNQPPQPKKSNVKEILENEYKKVKEPNSKLDVWMADVRANQYNESEMLAGLKKLKEKNK